MTIRLWRPLCHLAVILLAFTVMVSPDLRGQGRRARPTVMVDGREAVDGEVLVRFHSAVGAFEATRAEHEVEADAVEPVGRGGTRRMRARRLGTREMLAQLRANPDVEFVEPNYIIRIAATPTDPSFANLWGLFNVGQSYGAPGIAGADIDATLAWDISTGTRDNVVGIVDTGIDYYHSDLAANIWTSPSAFSVTVGGVVIDCAAGTHGFNAITNTCNPMDDHNHGTHVAGIIGAAGNNGAGVAGVNWTASMMGLKFLESNGSGTTANAIKAIEFAVQARKVLGAGANVRVLSTSWGGGYSQALLDEINRANTSDMLVVAAAGNDGADVDVSPAYPAAYSAPNIISVAATDQRDRRASFSNYGATTVHLGAPGVAILSTIRNNSYAAFSGTSIAAPHVSGVAALLLSTCALTTASLKEALLAAADPIPAMSGITTTGGRLNANNAIRGCPPIANAVSSLESILGSSVDAGTAQALNVLATPTVTPAAASVAAGGTMTFMVANGPGNLPDWVALFCPATGLDTAYIDWKYLSNTRTAPATGLTAATITFTAPPMGTTCNARLFANNGFSKLATSDTITVTGPGLALTIGPVAVAPGATLTVTLAGGPGNLLDWVALVCPATGADGTHIDWKYLNNTRTAPTTAVTAATLTFAAPSTAGTTCNARLFANNQLDKRATSATATVAGVVPTVTTVTPTSTTVAASGTMSFTVAAGPGNALDWVGLFCPATGADGTHVDWKYLSNSRTAPATGLTAATITFAAPSAATTCNARVFANDGFSKLATSATVTVTGSGPGPTLALTISPMTVSPGGTFTITLTGGPGDPLDWVALFCPATGVDSAYIDWKYLSNSRTAPTTGMTAATLTFVAPSAGGATCNARLFANNQLDKRATSATATVAGAVPTVPTVTPASATVPSSSTMSFAVTGGPGNVHDWVALYCPATSADSTYIDWKYLSNSRTAPATGLTAATITFAAPSAVGATCNTRLLANNGFSKLATSATVTTTGSTTPPDSGLASQYPGDVGIENDPNVVFVERFDEATMANLFGRWTDVLNGGAMTIGTDAPAGSPVGKSLTIPYSSGNSGGHLYRQLSQGVDDTLYVRYYIKHPTVNNYQHTGVWMGGYHPALGWPNPQAGTRPAGHDRFSAAAEQNSLNRFDHYNYWMGMRQANDSMYWGNHLLNDPDVTAPGGQWMCVEQMVKLNAPVTASNGEHAIWVDGVKVSHLGQGFPNGSWAGGIFTQNPSGTPFQGLQWRNNASLNLNWIWLQVYASNGSGNFTYAHVVAAKSYIGCLTSGSPSPTPPTVSMTAPANGATVSGTISVSATATDSVGVAGVQFKLDGANLGAEDTTLPYSVSLNTTTVANGSHTLIAVARNTSGLTSTASPRTVTVSNGGGGGSAWPNEPTGMTLVSDWALDQLPAVLGDVPIVGSGGWKIVQNALPGSSRGWTERVLDPTAPLSPSFVYDFVYPAGMVEGNAPSTVYYDGLSADEVFVGFWWKASSPFDYGPNGNKIAFIFNGGGGSGGGGQQFLILHTDGRLHVLPEYPGDFQWRTPNVNPTVVTLGQWHRIEWYTNRNTGALRWWLDGVLQGSHDNVHNSRRFDMFQFSPTWGGNIGAQKQQTDHYWFDHAHLSKR